MGAIMDSFLRSVRPARLVGGSVEVCACVLLSALLAAGCAQFEIPGQCEMFLPAIVACCWLRGLSGALAAGVLSVVVLWYFFIPPPGFALPSFHDSAHLLIFLGVAIFVCRILARERESNDQLMQENFELGYKVSLLREIRRPSSADGSRPRG
jgi:K+-sensing histidine kinase KdpD